MRCNDCGIIFPLNSEQRQMVIERKRFVIKCPDCGSADVLTSRGENMYLLRCR